MGTALKSTARGTNNIQSKKIIVDMSNRISLLQPSASPLVVLTKKLGTQACNNYKFEWMEKDLMGRWTTATAAKISTDTTIAVVDSTIFAVDDLVKVVTTGEIMRVTGVPDGISITVARGYGETAAGAVTSTEKLLCIGNAIMQGDSSPAEKYNVESTAYNYTQIFRTPFSVTNTLEAINLYGGSELARQQAEKAIEHAKSMEYAFLFGERKLDTTGSQPRTTTAGILKFLAGTANVTVKAKASAVYDDFNGWCEKLFTYGNSGSKVVLCSPSFITFASNMAKSAGTGMTVQNGADTFGLSVSKIVTPHGELNLVKHPLLVNGYDGYGIALEMDNLKYRPLQGRDTKLKTNVQNNDEDGRRDEYITEVGIELRQPLTHGIFQLT